MALVRLAWRPWHTLVVAISILTATTGFVGRASSTLPLPWSSTDIGNVGLAGSASFADGVFTVKGAGADIWGSADAFHFAHHVLNGNGHIVARVTAVQNTHTYAKAGVMLRGALTSGSAHVILDVKPGGGIEFMKRSSNGGTTAFLAGASAAAPVWVRLSRTDSTIVASWSSNGLNWTEVGRTTISLPASVYAGLAVTSHTTSALNTSMFDNVGVVPETPNQPPAVAITTPVDGAAFDAPASIAIAANASDGDGTVAGVQFFAGATSLGTDTTSPYEWLWDQVPAGSYALAAVATDSSGATTRSTTVNVTVAANPSVSPPAAPATGLPSNGSSGVEPSTALNWVASQNATHYDLAFGASSTPPVVSSNQTATYYQPPVALSYNTTYYWQVVAKNSGGATPGPVWSFTTKAAPTSTTPASTALRRLRVMSWNVNAGRSAAGAAAIDPQVSLMARSGAHVLLLQEVTREPAADLPALYQSKLEAATGRTWHAVWAEEPRGSEMTPQGNLILSVLPLASADVIVLEGDPFDAANVDARRSAARVSVVVNNVTVTIAGTMLALDHESRLSQIRQVQSWMGTAAAPRLIGGTMNMRSTDAGYAEMAGTYADVWSVLVTTPDRGVTTELFAPTAAPARVDGWWQELSSSRARASEVWIVKTARSDHHVLIAEVIVR